MKERNKVFGVLSRCKIVFPLWFVYFFLIFLRFLDDTDQSIRNIKLMRLRILTQII